jgi:hypothetical protein
MKTAYSGTEPKIIAACAFVDALASNGDCWEGRNIPLVHVLRRGLQNLVAGGEGRSVGTQVPDTTGPPR